MLSTRSTRLSAALPLGALALILAFWRTLVAGQAGSQSPTGAVFGPTQVIVASGFATSDRAAVLPQAKADVIDLANQRAGGAQKIIKNPLLQREGVIANPDALVPYDGALQAFESSTPGSPTMPSAALSFDGLASIDNTNAYGRTVAPPDTNGDVGPNHYVQMVNLLVRIFNKDGTPNAARPTAFKLSSLFAPLGGPCATTDAGDPVVLYDPLADRWLLTQFTSAAPFGECVAVSRTADPAADYYLYFFQAPNTSSVLQDYPHFGVWPDAYYMTTNQFNSPSLSFAGAGAFAFDRAKMLAGDPTASLIYVNEQTINPRIGGQLPTDFDGLTPPPANTPNLFFDYLSDEQGDAADALRVFEFRPNFANPASSTFTARPNVIVAPFDGRLPAGRTAIEQPPPAGPADALDAIADRLMYRVAYRNLGSVTAATNSYVLSFTVNVSGVTPVGANSYQAGVRYEELRRNSSTGAMSVHDQATFAPGAGDGVNGPNRWMGSAAQDNQGNIAVGFSKSGVSTFPSVFWAGRLAADPFGQLAQGESALVNGGFVQTGTNSRWGDYSAMTVDPVDECTFWYTNEHSASNATYNWRTRIGAFKFPSCTAPPRGQATLRLTDCSTGLPARALVTIDGVLYGVTLADGTFKANLPPGTYGVVLTGIGAWQGIVEAITVTIDAGGQSTRTVCFSPKPVLSNTSTTLTLEACAPPNGAVDPGERVTFDVTFRNTGAAPTTNLIATLQATANVISPVGPQGYGAIASGASATRAFSFVAAGACGSSFVATIQSQDGASNLGTSNINVQLGAVRRPLTQNFDGVAAPGLPAGWSAPFSGPGGRAWTTTSTTPDTPPNAAFMPSPDAIADNRLVSPAILIQSATAQISFRHSYSLEALYDGGVLEISIDGAAFQDVLAAGGVFAAGGYNSAISTAYQSPIGGRQAWTDDSHGYILTTLNLPASAQGRTIRLQWRLGADDSFAWTGWRVDTVTMSDGFECNQACATPRSDLSVNVAGSGRIVDDLGVLNCAGACIAGYPIGSSVVLTPVPNPGSTFAGWNGAADCRDGRVTMTTAQACGAVFVSQTGRAPGPQIVDLNGDGSGDAFRYNITTGQWSMEFSDRLGAFNVKEGQWSADWLVKAADFDGNGLADFFLYSRTTGQWFKVINQGAGEFSYYTESQFWSLGWVVTLVDLNRDGRSDVFLYDAKDIGFWFRCISTGAGTSGFACTRGQWGVGLTVTPIELNGDGFTDIFAYNASTGAWFKAFNDGVTGFALAPGSWSPFWGLTVGDYNGDARADLFLYNSSDGVWFTALNDPSQPDGWRYHRGQWSANWTVTPGDFDADGRTDLYLYDRGAGNQFVCFYDGAGGWAYAFVPPVSQGWMVAATDFNADGQADILFHNPVAGPYFQAITIGRGVFSYRGGNWGPGWTVVAAR